MGNKNMWKAGSAVRRLYVKGGKVTLDDDVGDMRLWMEVVDGNDG